MKNYKNLYSLYIKKNKKNNIIFDLLSLCCFIFFYVNASNLSLSIKPIWLSTLMMIGGLFFIFIILTLQIIKKQNKIDLLIKMWLMNPKIKNLLFKSNIDDFIINMGNKDSDSFLFIQSFNSQLLREYMIEFNIYCYFQTCIKEAIQEYYKNKSIELLDKDYINFKQNLENKLIT